MGINNQFMNEVLYKFTYDISGGDSGAIGAHVLGTLPENFVITQSWIHVLTTFTDNDDDSATMSLGYTGALTAFEAATAISTSTTWDAGAPRVSDAAADAAVGNFVTAAGGDDIIVTVADDVIDEGKFIFMVRGYIAD